MKKAVKILAERDGMSIEEANELVNDSLAECMDAIENGDFALAEDIWLGDTGMDLDDLLDMLI